MNEDDFGDDAADDIEPFSCPVLVLLLAAIVDVASMGGLLSVSSTTRFVAVLLLPLYMWL